MGFPQRSDWALVFLALGLFINLSPPAAKYATFRPLIYLRATPADKHTLTTTEIAADQRNPSSLTHSLLYYSTIPDVPTFRAYPLPDPPPTSPIYPTLAVALQTEPNTNIVHLSDHVLPEANVATSRTGTNILTLTADGTVSLFPPPPPLPPANAVPTAQAPLWTLSLPLHDPTLTATLAAFLANKKPITTLCTASFTPATSVHLIPADQLPDDIIDTDLSVFVLWAHIEPCKGHTHVPAKSYLEEDSDDSDDEPPPATPYRLYIITSTGDLVYQEAYSSSPPSPRDFHHYQRSLTPLAASLPGVTFGPVSKDPTFVRQTGLYLPTDSAIIILSLPSYTHVLTLEYTHDSLVLRRSSGTLDQYTVTHDPACTISRRRVGGSEIEAAFECGGHVRLFGEGGEMYAYESGGRFGR